MQEAGATADIEMAYTLADGLEYLRAGIKRRDGHRHLCAASLLLLGGGDELLHGDRQNARRADVVGQNRQTVQSTKSSSRWRCAPTAKPPVGA